MQMPKRDRESIEAEKEGEKKKKKDIVGKGGYV